MPERFFVAAGAVSDGAVRIEGGTAAHIARSLRMRAGEHVVVVDAEGGLEHGVRLLRVDAELTTGEVVWSRASTGEPRLRITVLQALPRERMDDCIDILVQAGAAAIQPVFTERVVTRLSTDRVGARLRRWRAVAAEAAQLAGRGVVPTVHEPVALDVALDALPASTQRVACTFEGETSIAECAVEPSRPLALCIGPEGGFGAVDLATLRDGGAQLVHMGARVVRTRYAGALACSVLLSAAGDLLAPLAVAPADAPG